jgi:hypothetical protein
MQLTITGTLEEIKALVERFPTGVLSASIDGPKPTPESSVGPALAKIVESQTGNNRKFVDFLAEKGNYQSVDAVVAKLGIQIPQLNGNIGALNKQSKMTGEPVILKKKRGRKMYYSINPAVLPHLSNRSGRNAA